MTPIRLQVMVGNKLIVELISSSEYCERIWAKWCALRYERNEDLGCAASFRADKARVWNISVGSVLES